MQSQATELYLDLLKKSLTQTLFQSEPDPDGAQERFIPDFVRHYIQGSAITMLPMARLNNLQSCIAEVVQQRIPGDLIETGVWRGGATIFMRGALKAYGAADRKVWVADSFEGLPKPDEKAFPLEAKAHERPIMTKMVKHFAAGIEDVKRNFEAYGLLDDKVQFLKGWFKDTLPTAPISQLAVMRLDGDYYESTIDALENLYDKLSVGGFAIIDDYGEETWTYCKKAVEDFRTKRNIKDPLIRVDSKCYYWKKTS
jgi:hypothetical protein